MTLAERAAQVWPLLAWAAKNKQTLTYTQVEKLTGMVARGLGNVLLQVLEYCESKKYPQLTVIVIGEDGQPGSGIQDRMTPQEVQDARKEVFGFDWLNAKPPNPEDLA